MIKRIFTINFLFFFYTMTITPANAQTIGNNLSLPNVLQPAPQSASLGRYVDIPVSVHTGVPNIAIPLCNIISGKLSLPISINYHASGIKVMDMASAVGMGWALNAGGDITRVVQGVPDESGYGFPTVRFPDANDPSLAAKEKCLSNYICNENAGGTTTWDGQPDLFYYTLGNRSGQFIEKNSSSISQQLGFMTMPYTPIRINAANSLKNFEITDEDGTQYFFTALDSSYSETNTSETPLIYTTAWHCVKIRSVNNNDSITFKYNTISQFGYVTNPSKVLQLNYNSYGLPYLFTWGTPSISTIAVTEYLLSEIDFNDGKLTLDYNNGYSAGQTMILNAIHLFNLKNGAYNELKRFTFYHSAFMNESVSTNVSRLDSLQVSGYYNNTSTPVDEPVYAFSYSNYDGWQCPPFNSFAQDFWGYFNGQTGNQDMIFVGQGTDATGSPVVVSNAYKREPDSNYLKVGTLSQIKYPIGAYTNFDLEPNQTTTQIPKFDTTHYHTSLNAYISTFGASPDDNSTFSSTFSADNYVSLYQVGSVYYNAELTLEVSPMCSNGSANCVYNQAFVQLNDITSGAPGPIISEINISNPATTTSTTQTVYFNLVAGHTYILNFPYQPVLPNSSSNFQNRLDANVTAQTKDSISVTSTQVTETVLTGGLRVRGIQSTDMAGHTLIKQYKYTGAYFNSPLFNGNFDELAVTSYAFQGWGELSAIGSCPETIGPRIISYTSNLPLPLGSVSNNSISYNEVEEYESDGQGNDNGKIVYDYNNKVQDIVPMQMPFFRVSKEDDRSLLTEKRTYKDLNGSYSLLQNIVYNYENLDSTIANADTVVFYTAHALVDQATADNFGGNVNGGAQNACLGCTLFDAATNYLTNRYYYTSSRFVPASTIVTNYGNNGNAMTSATNYNYQNPTHAFPTHINTISSAGKTLDTYTEYVLDQPSAPSCVNNCSGTLSEQLISLKNFYFNIFNSQSSQFSDYQNLAIYYSCTEGVDTISARLYQVYSDSTIAVENAYQQTLTNYQNGIDSLINIYNTCASNYNGCVASYYTTTSANQKATMDLKTQNNILPHLEDSTYTNSVLMSRQINNYLTFLPNVTLPSIVQFATLNNPLESRLQFDQYDVHGNILEQQKTNDIIDSYVWDYDSTYPIAEVTNASQTDIAYTSFEADGKGNWTFSGTPSNAGGAITGNQSYSLSTGGSISKSGLTSATKYIISYWSKGSVSVSGGTQTNSITGKTINGWTYHEVMVTGTTSVSISGSTYIDELRLYPSDAQMVTYTYEPLIGMTSQCDVDNKIQYYEYDALGRLQDIKDQDGNIIRTFEYHYQQNAQQ